MTLSRHLAPLGLMSMGIAPEGGGSVVLIGPDNRRFWPLFAESPEALDGAPHPLDRWSERVIGALADELGATAAFPFGGPPYAPFIRWAKETGTIWSSPIGPLVGAQAGLWISFRGALIFEHRLEQPPATNPCPSCAQPCKTACPVDAFGGGAYDTVKCRAHLRSPEGTVCMTFGCQARAACPVGPAFSPMPDQARLHMTAFRGADGQ